MRWAIIVFPGSNCDDDCYWALKDVLSQEVEFIWHKEDAKDVALQLHNFDVVVLPGGFSYGDYLRTGAIAKFSNVMSAVIDFAKSGGLVIGICNGFQILLEAGLLPGAMVRNKNLQFICKYVQLRVENNQVPWTSNCQINQVLKIPIAHMEGCYYLDEQGIDGLISKNQIILRYCDAQGQPNLEANPNGSLYNIAGICNEAGNVFGLMPHPERSMDKIFGSQDGRIIFESVINFNNKRKLINAIR